MWWIRLVEYIAFLKDARNTILQIVEYMHYLHQNKVVHWGLELANVLIIKCYELCAWECGWFGLFRPTSSICKYSENIWESEPYYISSLVQYGKVLKHPFKVDVHNFQDSLLQDMTNHFPFYKIMIIKEVKKNRKKKKRWFVAKILEQYPTSLAPLLETCFPFQPYNETFNLWNLHAIEACQVFSHCELKCSIIKVGIHV